MRSSVLLICFLIGVFAASCSIQKRHYRSGFYIDHSHAEYAGAKNDRSLDSFLKKNPSAVNESWRREEVSPNEFARDSAFVSEDLIERRDDIHTTVDSTERFIRTLPAPIVPDEPKPQKDKPNKKILALILIGFALSFCPIIAIYAVSTFLFTLVLCMPAVAVLLYLLALRHRQKVLEGIARGEKGDRWRISNFYHRFSLALHLFFGAILAGQIGIMLLYLTEYFGIAIGLSITAITLASIMFIFLIVMSILYLSRWRKVGENHPKSWEKRPKDG